MLVSLLECLVCLAVVLAVLGVFRNVITMCLEHDRKKQLARQDHEERMKALVQEHAERVASMTPLGTELEVRSVHVQIRTSELPTALMLVAEIERRNR